MALYTRLHTRSNASNSPEDTDGSVRKAEERSAPEVEMSVSGERETDAQLSMELLETEIKRILPHFAPFLRAASSSASDAEPADGNYHSSYLGLLLICNYFFAESLSTSVNFISAENVVYYFFIQLHNTRTFNVPNAL